MPSRVVVLGGLNFDLIVETPHFAAPGETVEASRYHEMFGGKGGNQAVAAARMGAEVEMVGRVGTDAYGGALLEHLRDSGVGTNGITRDGDARTGLAFVFIDESGENTVTAVYGANSLCGDPERDAAEGFLDGADALLVQQEVSFDVTREVMTAARGRGVIVLLDPAPARDRTAKLLPSRRHHHPERDRGRGTDRDPCPRCRDGSCGGGRIARTRTEYRRRDHGRAGGVRLL